MANNIHPCGTCELYWPLEHGGKGGKRRQLLNGYCLNRCVFASNKPGNPVYPPKAKTEELPNAMHKIVLVNSNSVQPHCQYYKGKNR